jgi:hypothetical protein
MKGQLHLLIEYVHKRILVLAFFHKNIFNKKEIGKMQNNQVLPDKEFRASKLTECAWVQFTVYRK